MSFFHSLHDIYHDRENMEINKYHFSWKQKQTKNHKFLHEQVIEYKMCNHYTPNVNIKCVGVNRCNCLP